MRSLRLGETSLIFGAICAAVTLWSACARGTEAPVYDIPRIDKVAVDGDAADWGDGGLRIDSFAPVRRAMKAAQDWQAHARLGWNDEGLLLLVFWHDANWDEATEVSDISNHDSMEVFFSPKPGPSMLAKWFVSPGMDPKQPAVRTDVVDRRNDLELLKASAEIRVARKATADGCVLEALIPWKPFGITPQLGTVVAFQVAFNDQETSDYYPLWTVVPGESATSLVPHALRLSEKASSPVVERLRASGGYVVDKFQTQVSIDGKEEYAGKTAVIKDDEGREVAKAEFKDNGPASAHAEVTFAMPPVGKPYKTLSVEIDGKKETSFDMQDADALRAWAFMHAEVAAKPAPVFEGDALPTIEFASPELAKNLIGPYSIKTVYYGSDYKTVTKAETPGRYAAVAVITAEGGRAFKRFLTLCRIAHEKEKDVARDTSLIAQRNSMDPGNPMLMAAVAAWIQEGFAGQQAGFYTNPAQIDRQWWVSFKRTYYGYDKRWPKAFVCPKPIEGKEATVVHEGTLAEAGMKPKADKVIDTLLTQWASDSDQAFGVCVVRHGIVVIHKAYGTREEQPMTVTTKSWNASISKIMSGTLMMMCVDQGLVKLDNPVGAYLPAFDGVKTNKPLTIRRLYNHTDGLDEHYGNYANDMEERMAALAPSLEVGKFYRYNGTGLELGGKVMEAVSGQSLPNFFKTHLLDPLGCENTDIGSGSYDASTVPMDMARIGQMLLNKGAYGKMRFMRAETFEKMLPLPIKDQIDEDTAEEYGVGSSWAIRTYDTRAFGHGAASSATFIVSPAADMVVVMTRNAAGKNFQKYNTEFLKTVWEQIVDAPAVESTATK